MVKIELALVICGPGEDRTRVLEALQTVYVNPICCETVKDARCLLPQDQFRVVVCNETLPDGDFRMVLKRMEESGSSAPLIVLSHSTDSRSYLKGLRVGAFDYITCPLNPIETERVLWSALAVKTPASLQPTHP